MPRDYAPKKRRTQRRPRKKTSTNQGSLLKWFWGISGCFLGAFVTILVMLKLNDPAQPQAPKQLAQAEVAPAEKIITPEKKSTQGKKPNFDFYTILPEMEVVIPNKQQTKPQTIQQAKRLPSTSTNTPSATKPSPSNDKYVLQLASFKSYKDADQLKAQLALQGVIVSIETVKLDNGETWHRVRSGPYATQALAESQRNQLEKHQVNSLLLKMKS